MFEELSQCVAILIYCQRVGSDWKAVDHLLCSKRLIGARAGTEPRKILNSRMLAITDNLIPVAGGDGGI